MKRRNRLSRVLLGVALSIGAAACSTESGSTAQPSDPSATAVESAPTTIEPPAGSPASDPAAAEDQAPGRSRRADLRQRFDQNNDGHLDDAERAAMTRARAEQLLDRYDTDKDGTLSQSERTSINGPGRRLMSDTTADQNGDGILTKAELETLLSHRGRQRQGRSNPEDSSGDTKDTTM